MNRRTFIYTSASLSAIGTLAGCLGSETDDDVPDPIDLSGTKFDYSGGMEIGAHGGPNGQIFYESETPQPAVGDGTQESDTVDENLAWFHTLVFGLLPYHFERLDRGWEPQVLYVTDYSLVDYELNPEEDTDLVMPAPTSAETFTEATELTYVGESVVRGGMGQALHPFSDEDDATSFAERFDGTTYEFDNLNRTLVRSLQEESEM